MMRYKYLCILGVVLYLLTVVSANSISYFTGSNTVYIGDGLNISVTTSNSTNVSYVLYNTIGDSVSSGFTLISGTSVITFSSSLISSTGNWAVVLSDESATYYHNFTVVEAVYFKIFPLESNYHGANRMIKVTELDTWNPGTTFQVAEMNVTKSGILYNGTISEGVIGCDLDGDRALNTTLYVWLSDYTTNGTYDRVFLDDDAVINETPSAETGKIPKTFLRMGDASVKCVYVNSTSNWTENATDLAPYLIRHIYPGGVYLQLAPGPGDRPYRIGGQIDAVILAYNGTNAPIATNLTSFNIRYRNVSSGLFVEQNLNALLIANNQSTMNSTGSDGLSWVFSYNTSQLFNDISDSGPGEYVMIVNDLATETLKILPSWTVTVLIGDPITETEKYDFELNDTIAVGMETTATNVSFTVDIFDDDDDLRKSWYYNSAASSGIFYDNNSGLWIAGMTTAYAPLLTVDEVGEWHAEVTVKSGTEERYFERAFNVKAFDLSVFAVIPPASEGGKVVLDQLTPGEKGFIGVFAFKFGKAGNLEDNFNLDDMILLDGNTTDTNNTCNTSISYLEIRDSYGNVVAEHPDNWQIIDDIDNTLQILTTYGGGPTAAPEEFHGQCMIYIGNVTLATGGYTVTATVSAEGSTETVTSVFDIRDIDTWAEPWDLTSNHFKRIFNPGSNVTFKVNVENLYTKSSVDPADVVNIELLKVFNPDFGGPVTDLIDGYGFGTATVSGEDITVLWVDLGNQTAGFHHVKYRVKATINASGVIRNSTGMGSGGVETRLYDIKGHPAFTRNTEYFRPDEDIAFHVEVWSPQGHASDVDVYIQSIHLFNNPDLQINYSAARATTGSDGRANVTIRPTTGNWPVGDYDVRIRVKDSEGNIDFGFGWFDVKSFQVIVIPVDVEISGNTTVCEKKDEFRDRGDFEDEMEKGGALRISGDQNFAIIGVNESGTFLVTPLLEKSRLFQLTNLNGEPVFDDVQPNVSDLGNCTASGLGAAQYFTLYTGDLGGEYEVEIVVQDASGRLGTGYAGFYVSPFFLDVFMKVRGEPVFSPGDTITLEVETEEDYNITGLSILRLIRVSKMDDLVPGAAQNMTGSIIWLTDVNWSRKVSVTVPPSGFPGIRKGEYVMQMEFTVTDDTGESQTLVYTQWLIIKPFTYSLGRTLYSWADSFNTTKAYQFGYWDEDHGSHYFDLWDDGGCPFPVINRSEGCALVNRTHVRANVLELWQDCSDCNESYYEFVNYFNGSGTMNAFQGFHMIVGPVSFESTSGAKVYVVKDESQLYNDSLTAYSVGDIITDDSGAAFRISQIRQGDIRLKPVTFAGVWDLRTVYFNNTDKTLSGAIRLGTISEGEVRIDFNGDGNFKEEWDNGLPFVLYDPTISGVYDIARVDTDMDLDFDEEQELTIGGNGTLLNISGQANRMLYLVKADSFDVIFVLNETGRDDWLGTHRKNVNITIPIYSKTTGLNLSIAAIWNARKRQQVTNYTSYNATVGSDGIGLLTVNIAESGHYVVQYQVASGSTTDVPEPWESPFIEVRAFDSRRDIFQEVLTIPAFTRLNGTAARMTWWESRGYQMEWINNNGTILQTMLNTLPSGVTGFAIAERRCMYVPHECSENTSIYLLYDKDNDTLYIRNSTSANFTGVTGVSSGEVAFTRIRRWPDGDENDVYRNITVSLVGRRCWYDGCQLVLQETQSVPAPQNEVTAHDRPCYSTGYGELCAFGFDTPGRESTYYMWMNNTETNATQIFIFTNVTNLTFNSDNPPDLTLAHETVVIDANGQPNTTQNFTVYGDRNEEDWCTDQVGGCLGGEYLVHVRIINVTWDSGSGGHQVWYNFDETYNSSDFWADMEVNASLSLVGPSSAYYVRYIGWKGVWMAIDVSNPSDPQLYVSTDGNLSGTGYGVGDTVYIYDKWLEYSVPFSVTSITPRNYGTYILHDSVNQTIGSYIVWVTDINTSTNRAVFRVYDTDCDGCGVSETAIEATGNSEEINNVRFTLNNVSNSTSVNVSIKVTSRVVKWGYNTDGLSSALNETFYNDSFQIQVGNITLDGTDYVLVALDSNSSESDTEFTRLFVSTDTSLTDSELITLGNTSAIVGDYYLSLLDTDRVVFIQNVVDILGIPLSDDNLGYYYSIAQPSDFTGVLANNSNNYTFIMYAEERWDEVAVMGKIRMDDDSNMMHFDDDCTDIGDDENCTDKDLLAGTITPEPGRIAEEEGEMGQWNWMDFKIKNDTSGLFYRRWYDIWDQNISEPVRIFRRFDGWWGEFITNTSNITIGIKVIEFNGSAVQGNVTVTDIYLMGEFYGEWVEMPLSTFNNINYSLYYDGATANSTTLDSDGIMFVTISLVDNTTWWNGYGYEIRININSTSGDGEETGMWFDLGKRYKEDREGSSDACNDIRDDAVCGNYSSVCEWDSSTGDCNAIDELINCRKYASDLECINPCIWVTQQSRCIACSNIDDETGCDAAEPCTWDDIEEECYRHM